MRPYVIRIWGPYENTEIRDQKKNTEPENDIAVVFANTQKEATNIAFFVSNFNYSKSMGYENIRFFHDYQLIDSCSRPTTFFIYNPQDVIHFNDEQMQGLIGLKKSNLPAEDPMDGPDLSLYYAALYKASKGEDVVYKASKGDDITHGRTADAACFVYSKDDSIAKNLCISFAESTIKFNPFEDEGVVKVFDIKERTLFWNPKYNIFDEYSIYEKGITLAKNEMLDEAIDTFNFLLIINPNSVDGYFNRGHCYNKKGNYEKALIDMTYAIKADANHYHSYAYRGAIYQNLGRYQEAIDDFTQAIKYEPTYLLLRGESYKGLKLYDKAINDINRYLKIKPNDSNAIKLQNELFNEIGEGGGGKGWIKKFTSILKK